MTAFFTNITSDKISPQNSHDFGHQRSKSYFEKMNLWKDFPFGAMRDDAHFNEICSHCACALRFVILHRFVDWKRLTILALICQSMSDLLGEKTASDAFPSSVGRGERPGGCALVAQELTPGRMKRFPQGPPFLCDFLASRARHELTPHLLVALSRESKRGKGGGGGWL